MRTSLHLIGYQSDGDWETRHKKIDEGNRCPPLSALLSGYFESLTMRYLSGVGGGSKAKADNKIVSCGLVGKQTHRYGGPKRRKASL